MLNKIVSELEAPYGQSDANVAEKDVFVSVHIEARILCVL